MTDPAKNVEIEDVLASIRRLVSDDLDREDLQAALHEMSAEDQASPLDLSQGVDEETGSFLAEQGAIEQGAEAEGVGQRIVPAEPIESAPEALVLTPALRVGTPTRKSDPDKDRIRPGRPVSKSGLSEKQDSDLRETLDPRLLQEDDGTPDDATDKVIVSARAALDALRSNDDHAPEDAEIAGGGTESGTESDQAEDMGHAFEGDASDGPRDVAFLLTQGAPAMDEPQPSAEDLVARFEEDAAADPRTSPEDVATEATRSKPLVEDASGALILTPALTSEGAMSLKAKVAKLETLIAQRSDTWEKEAPRTAAPDMGWSNDDDLSVGEGSAETKEWSRPDDTQEIADKDGKPDPENDLNDNLLDSEDEAALRAIIVDVVRAELRGAQGEHLTRKIRRMVRQEIHRALELRDGDPI